MHSEIIQGQPHSVLKNPVLGSPIASPHLPGDAAHMYMCRAQCPPLIDRRQALTLRETRQLPFEAASGHLLPTKGTLPLPLGKAES